MAKLVGAEAVAMVSFLGDLHGQRVITTWHYMIDVATVGTQDGQALAGAMRTFFIGAGKLYQRYLAVMPAEWVAEFMDIQWIAPTRFRKDSFVRTDIGGGGSTTTANLACAITLQGDQANRRSQAVKHIPGVGGADATAGLLNAPYLVLAEALRQEASNDILVTGTTLHPIIYGRAIPADPTAVPPVAGQVEKRTLISSGFVNTKVRVQRRRTVGLGE